MFFMGGNCFFGGEIRNWKIVKFMRGHQTKQIYAYWILVIGLLVFMMLLLPLFNGFQSSDCSIISPFKMVVNSHSVRLC